MRCHLTVIAALVVLLCAASTMGEAKPNCVWVIDVMEGNAISGVLPAKWESSACDASYLSFSAPQPPTGFAITGLRTGDYTYTPAMGTGNTLQRVDLNVNCRIFTPVCDVAAIFFAVTAAPTTTTPTTTAPPTTTTTTPVPTTPAPTSSGETAAPTSAATTATDVTTSTTLATTTPTTTTATPTTTTPTTTSAPLSQCPGHIVVGSTVPGHAATFDMRLATPMTSNLTALSTEAFVRLLQATCSAAVTLKLVPGSEMYSNMGASVSRSGMWVVVRDGLQIIFDSLTTNMDEGIFYSNYTVSCGDLPICDFEVQIASATGPTLAPLPDVPECRAVYGFDGYFSQLTTNSLVGIAGETSCDDGQSVNFTALRNPDFFDRFAMSTTSFTYLAPSGPFLDKFVVALQCNNIIKCTATVFVETASDSPRTTMSTPAPTTPRCPDTYMLPVVVEVPSSVTTLNLAAATAQCSTAVDFSYTSSALYGTILQTAVNGVVRYLTPSTFSITVDHFNFIATCNSSTVGPWSCEGTTNILVSRGDPTTTAPTTTQLPADHVRINDQFVCSGSCDADDILKVTSANEEVFDNPNNLGTAASRVRKDGVPIGTISTELTGTNTILITVYGKIGNMLSGRIPTFDKINADTYFTGASVGMASTSTSALNPAIAFNGTCLNLQSKYGIAEELWEWTNLSTYTGTAVGNYKSGDNIYQKFGGKHNNCDTFKADSCKYAPTLTPALVSNDDSTALRWSLEVNGCDETWTTEVSIAHLRNLRRQNAGSLIFERLAPSLYSTSLYSQSIKPIRWHPPFTGVMSTATIRDIIAVTRNEVTNTITDTTAAAPVAAARRMGIMEEGDNATTTTTTAVADTTTTVVAPTTVAMADTTTSTTVADATTATTAAATATDVGATTTAAAPVPNATTATTSTVATTNTTTATTTTPTTLHIDERLTLTSDVESFIDVNAKTERVFGYNVILYPSVGTALDRISVSKVSLVSTEYFLPMLSNCPGCTGNKTVCNAAVDGAITRSGGTLATDCNTDSADLSMVTFTAGTPVVNEVCVETTPEVAEGDATPTPITNCTPAAVNISLRGVLRGEGTTFTAGLPEAKIVVAVEFNNGQVFQVEIDQGIYVSQIAAGTQKVVENTVCRSTRYFPVRDPLGVSGPTLAFTEVSASTEDVSQTCSSGATVATVVSTAPAVNGAAKLCQEEEETTFSPVEWVYFRTASNDTLTSLTLTVPASEVLNTPTVDTLTFQLAGSTAVEGALSWSTYAAFLNFRRIETASGSNGVPVYAFALIPGTLLKPTGSLRTTFFLEAVFGDTVVRRHIIVSRAIATGIRHEISATTDDYGFLVHYPNDEEDEDARMAFIIVCVFALIIGVSAIACVALDESARSVVSQQHRVMMAYLSGNPLNDEKKATAAKKKPASKIATRKMSPPRVTDAEEGSAGGSRASGRRFMSNDEEGQRASPLTRVRAVEEGSVSASKKRRNGSPQREGARRHDDEDAV